MLRAGGSRLDEVAVHFVTFTKIELAFLNITVKNQRKKMGIDKDGQMSLNFWEKRPFLITSLCTTELTFVLLTLKLSLIAKPSKES